MQSSAFMFFDTQRCGAPHERRESYPHQRSQRRRKREKLQEKRQKIVQEGKYVFSSAAREILGKVSKRSLSVVRLAHCSQSEPRALVAALKELSTMKLIKLDSRKPFRSIEGLEETLEKYGPDADPSIGAWHRELQAIAAEEELEKTDPRRPIPVASVIVGPTSKMGRVMGLLGL